MRLTFFTIPALDSEAIAAELNRFLAANRIVAIDRQFIADGANSFWAICVAHSASASASVAETLPSKKGRIDYKEILDAEEFATYAKLRELRKAIAEREGVPPYALFTNEQLAAMVQRRVATRAQLEEIRGIGEVRARKYGEVFLSRLRAGSGSQQADDEIAAQEGHDGAP